MSKVKQAAMATKLNPYFSFGDNAREAMEFYRDVFGGKLTISTFGNFHTSQDPADEHKVMHSQLDAENGITVMASDTPTGMPFQPGMNGGVSLSGDDEAELRGYWDKLSSGGAIIMPLEKAQWGDAFGMCTDKFGIRWLVNIAGQRQGQS